MTRTLRVAIPNRHVTGAVMELLAEAGFRWQPLDPRQLSFVTEDGLLRVCLVKSHDIPGKVADGVFDLGFVQASVIAEEGGATMIMRELPMALGRMVLGVAEDSAARSVEDLAGERVATRNPRIAARFLGERGVECELFVVGGSPEAYVPAGAAGAALVYWKTGATFRANSLRVLGEVCRSQLLVIASAAADGERRQWFVSRIDERLERGAVPERWRLA